MSSSLTLKLAIWNASISPIQSTKVSAVAASQDTLVCGYTDGYIWLYSLGKNKGSLDNADDIQPKCLLSGHQRSPIRLLRLSEINAPTGEDGREPTVLSVSEDGDVILWSLLDGRCITRIRTPLTELVPTSITIQTIDSQSSAATTEDLVFISGKGSVLYVLSYPSLEIVHSWPLPHHEWVTALAVRKRKDHFRSELTTCASNGVLRVWSYDEYALLQQQQQPDMFSRPTSPTPFNPMTQFNESGTESASPDIETTSTTDTNRPLFILDLETSVESINYLAINPYNEDEFLAVSPNVVRLLGYRDRGDLHEMLRWKRPASRSIDLIAGGFLTKSDIVFWDQLGNITSVCSSFSVAGGSAGMHFTKSPFQDGTTVCCQLNTISSTRHVLVSACARTHQVSLVLPAPLSSVSGSANRPHVVPEDAKSGPRNWLGQFRLLPMATLWDKWTADLDKNKADVTAARMSYNGKVILGHSNGDIHLTAPVSLIADSQKPSKCLTGHRSSVTSLFEWMTPGTSHCNRCHPDETQSNDPLYSRCSHCDPPISFLLSGSKDLTLRIWEEAGECMAILPTQSAPIVRICEVGSDNNLSSSAIRCLLRSLVLAIGSDNSTTLISMESLERAYVTTPYHSSPTHLTIDRESGDLALHYADSSQRCIVISHMLATADRNNSQSSPITADDNDDLSLDGYSIDLSEISTSTTNNPRLSKKSGNKYVGVSMLSTPQALGYHSTYRKVNHVPIALVLNIDVMQLETLVARLVPDGTTRQEVQHLLESEQADSTQQQPLLLARMLLSVLCTWGISDALDTAVKRTAFGMRKPRANLSVSISNKSSDIFTIQPPWTAQAAMSWCMSPLLNSQRMLSILVLSRGVLQGNEKRAVELINFYVGKSPGEIGADFKPLSLMALARYWQSSNGNLQRAARTLILSTVHGAAEKLRKAELFYWSSVLASRRTTDIVGLDAEQLCALTIVCVIGADYPALLPLTARSMAATILQALIASHGQGQQAGGGIRARMMAIELLSRGFATFKPYLDCRLVIQSLLAIMMSISDGGNNEKPLAAAPNIHHPRHHLHRGGEHSDTEGLGIHRTSSGASLPALIPTRHSSSDNNGPEGEKPRPIPQPSGNNSKGGSLATTPTNAMPSLARTAVTQSAFQAQQQQQQHQSNNSEDQQQPQLRSRRLNIGDSGGGTMVSFNLIVLAKSALLRITAAETSLVVSTLTGLFPQTTTSVAAGSSDTTSSLKEECGSTIRERRGALQLVGLVAQKYPTHIYPYLDTLVSAIVRAIEPKRATTRKLLIGPAGAALQGLVKAYPWVSFHPESQCLAVGCIDGRCTAYDLRTATRTAVFDGGAASPVAAVAIAPQGDQVASFTLGDGMLSIWDPAPSAIAMFARSLFDSGRSLDAAVTAGKSMKIPAGYLDHAAELPISSVMAVAKLSWTGKQTVLLQIHEASFSLSV